MAAYSPALSPMAVGFSSATAATRLAFGPSPYPARARPFVAARVPPRSATLAGPLHAHARLRFKKRAPAADDDGGGGGGGAKETAAAPCAAADNNNGSEGSKEAAAADPHAGLWPWGELPDDDELKAESFSEVRSRFSRESKEAAAALKGMAAAAFRPLLDNFRQLRSLKTVFDTEDYHIGMPFGALVACMGCYQLWKMDPSMFLDAALGYAFYKLSVVASQLRKQGFSNDLITRVQFVIMVIMAANDFKNKLCPFDAIRGVVYFLYALTFAYEVTGVKKQIKFAMAAIFLMLTHAEGRRELRKMLPEVELEFVSECGIVI